VITALGIGVATSAHFIYIPIVVILGIVLGFIMGSRATRDAFALEARKAEERAARKAARAAAAGDAGKPPASSAP
jgi:arginine exporter protein ArgO